MFAVPTSISTCDPGVCFQGAVLGDALDYSIIFPNLHCEQMIIEILELVKAFKRNNIQI